MYRHPGRIAAAFLAWLFSLVWIGALFPRLGVGRPTVFFWFALVSAVVIGSVLVFGYRQSLGEIQGSLRGRGKHVRVDTMPRSISGLERVVPFVGLIVGLPWILIPGIRSGGTPEFLMHNDMVWNTGQSMMIHSDGGVAPLTNPAPMTNLLYAFAYGPSSAPSLRTILMAHFVVLVITMVLASVVPAMHVARTAERAHFAYRLILPMAAGWLPFTGPILGQSIDMGHANVLLAYVVTVFSWIAFVEFRNPAMRAAILGCATTVSLATWGPLVIVPLSLGVASLPSLWEHRPWRAGARSWPPYLLMLASVLQMAAYGILVTLPDLRVSGSALGGMGSMLAISLGDMAVVCALYTGVIFLYLYGAKDQQNRRRLGGGAILALIFSLGVIAVLTLEAYRAYAVFHGYYQIKFASIFFAVLTVIALTLVGQIVSAAGSLPWRRLGAATLALAVMGSSVFLSWGRWSLQQQAEDSTLYGPISAVNPMLKYRHDARDQRIEDLIDAFDATYPHRGLFLYRYVTDEDLADPSRWFTDSHDADAYVDRYMIQLSTIHDEKNRYEIRQLAYGFPMADPAWVCNLIELWGDEQPITVFTSPEYYDRAADAVSQCPASVTVTTDLTGEND